MDTGEIEVQLESVKSINQSEVKLPFYVKSFNEAQETLRHSVFFVICPPKVLTNCQKQINTCTNNFHK